MGLQAATAAEVPPPPVKAMEFQARRVQAVRVRRGPVGDVDKRAAMTVSYLERPWRKHCLEN